ncbi:YdcF family protein [Schlegelella sp. S2-27]|uniref:YdcF family protein n=1 Tax=Caldimonas mangrovi TaxID=2944811 RepID=A0ABT0YNC4_9BURK|nr:YdcF family protein [Caldimonas mangrovi]MCM5679666.1 YdcF family protein [Caldimonas mangrovi]
MLESLAFFKPVLTALLLPPASLIVLVLIGVRLLLPRRGLGFSIVLLACIGLWLTSTQGFSHVLQTYVLKAPRPLGPIDLESLRDEVKAAARTDPKGSSSIAVVVLGGGMEPRAPEYGVSDLSTTSLERLRYGLWLSRQIGAPVGFSGGLGWAQLDGEHPEARIAQRIAQEEYGRSLKWVEDSSRDTRENAGRSAALLRHAGVKKVLVVTSAWHMPRAARAFREALGPDMTVVPAPMGLFAPRSDRLLDWLPSTEGLVQNRVVLRELLGLLADA